MNTKTKIFITGIIAFAGLFAGANFVSAQTATLTTVDSCTSATLRADVYPNGGTAEAWFEWGNSYATVDAGVGTRTSSQWFTYNQSLSQSISSLSQNTKYYYRGAVRNNNGTMPSYGSILSFTTPSCNTVVTTVTVTTSSASSVSQNSATLNGYVVPNNTNTSVWFEYGTTQAFGLATPNMNYGNTTSFSGYISGLNPNTTYYFRAMASGATPGNTLSFTTTGTVASVPIVTTSSASSVSQNSATLNGYVVPNGVNTNAYFEYGTTQSFGNVTSSVYVNSSGTGYTSSISGLNPNTTYYYRAMANNAQGNTTPGNTLSFTTNAQVIVNTGAVPTVTTLLATERTGVTARLNGLVFATGNQTANAWFEWGTDSSMSNKTQVSNVGALPTVKHSDYITGLVQGQKYYYRIVAENSYGKVYGEMNTFVSEVSVAPAPVTITPSQPKPAVLKPVTVAVTSTGNSAQSLVSLILEGGEDTISVGEKRVYHVSWKNESKQTLKNVVLRVTFPSQMNVESATKGEFSSADNSVVVDLGTLVASGNGETFIFASPVRGVGTGQLLVVTANMVYTEEKGVQGDVLAYATHTTEETQGTPSLGANVFGAGDFLPVTVLGWVLLIISILVLVILGNHLYGRFADNE